MLSGSDRILPTVSDFHEFDDIGRSRACSGRGQVVIPPDVRRWPALGYSRHARPKLEEN